MPNCWGIDPVSQSCALFLSNSADTCDPIPSNQIRLSDCSVLMQWWSCELWYLAPISDSDEMSSKIPGHLRDWENKFALFAWLLTSLILVFAIKSIITTWSVVLDFKIPGDLWEVLLCSLALGHSHCSMRACHYMVCPAWRWDTWTSMRRVALFACFLTNPIISSCPSLHGQSRLTLTVEIPEHLSIIYDYEKGYFVCLSVLLGIEIPEHLWEGLLCLLGSWPIPLWFSMPITTWSVLLGIGIPEYLSSMTMSMRRVALLASWPIPLWSHYDPSCPPLHGLSYLALR